MSKIKVIHLADNLNRGGLEKVIALIVQGLNRNQYDVEIWCMAEGGIIADELREAGFVVKILGITSYLNPFNIIKVAAQMRKSKPIIVHMHGFFCQVIGALASALAKVPVRIVHLHTTLNNFTKRDVWRVNFVNRFVDKVIYIAQAAYESSQRVGCGHADKSVVIYNGIESKDQSGQLASAQKNIVTIVASLYEHKGHTYLLDAVKILKNNYLDIHLWIIGEGPLKKNLEQKTRDLHIEQNVTFWGEQKDINRFLSQTKIFVLSSLREGLSLATIEAMAQARPVVASRIGGIPEVVKDGVTGYLVEPKNSKQFAEKIALLLSNKEKQDQMGKEARLVFEKKFSSAIMINQVEQMYDKLIRVKVRS